jgi:hypothetical protein
MYLNSSNMHDVYTPGQTSSWVNAPRRLDKALNEMGGKSADLGVACFPEV